MRQSAIEHNNQVQSAERQKDWAKEHPARASTGMIPLSELGKANTTVRKADSIPAASHASRGTLYRRA